MRQMTLPNQMIALSPTARTKLNRYLKSKNWGMEVDGGYIYQTQLTIGQLIEFLVDHKIVLHLTADFNICDNLWKMVTNVLEEKN